MLKRRVTRFRARQRPAESAERLRWKKKKRGKRRARRVGPGGTRSSLPAIDEEEWDTFLERVDDVLPQQRGQNGRIIYTPALRDLGSQRCFPTLQTDAVWEGILNRGRNEDLCCSGRYPERTAVEMRSILRLRERPPVVAL
eukprot:1906137-Amphidinium_carterae.1